MQIFIRQNQNSLNTGTAVLYFPIKEVKGNLTQALGVKLLSKKVSVISRDSLSLRKSNHLSTNVCMQRSLAERRGTPWTDRPQARIQTQGPSGRKAAVLPKVQLPYHKLFWIERITFTAHFN